METSAHTAPDTDDTFDTTPDGPGLNGFEVTMVATGLLTAAVTLLTFCLKYIPDFMGVHL